jgi:1-acyl-sn-glycerol-3-phosphate acyltransferase
LTLGVLLHAAVATFRISVPTLWDAARGRLSEEVCDRRLDYWSRALIERAGMRLSVSGANEVARERAFVVMSNHQSHYDIPVIFQALPLRIRMVAKRELFRVPLWAQAMRSAGFVELDRGDRRRAIDSLNSSQALLARGTSIWIAPEGTRSQSGELGPFKKGGFRLAVDARAPILPVSIQGTRDALPAHGRKVRLGASVRVTVHPALETSGASADALDELMDHVRAVIAAGLRDGAR